MRGGSPCGGENPSLQVSGPFQQQVAPAPGCTTHWLVTADTSLGSSSPSPPHPNGPEVLGGVWEHWAVPCGHVWVGWAIPLLGVKTVAALAQDGRRAGSRGPTLPVLLLLQALQLLSLAALVLLDTQLLQQILQADRTAFNMEMLHTVTCPHDPLSGAACLAVACLSVLSQDSSSLPYHPELAERRLVALPHQGTQLTPTAMETLPPCMCHGHTPCYSMGTQHNTGKTRPGTMPKPGPQHWPWGCFLPTGTPAPQNPHCLEAQTLLDAPGITWAL